MGRGTSRARLRWAVAAVALGVVGAGLPADPAVAGSTATDLLPNLRMLRPAELHLCAAPLASDACPAPTTGTLYLRFSATMTNVGRGPFQVRGKRVCAGLRPHDHAAVHPPGHHAGDIPGAAHAPRFSST